MMVASDTLTIHPLPVVPNFSACFSPNVVRSLRAGDLFKGTEMRKPPAFQFYADDFLAGTIDMTAEETGIYIKLLCYQWSKGKIPFATSLLGGLLHGSHVAKCEEVLKKKFVRTDDGWQNERLEEVRRIQEVRKQAGKRGGQAKAASKTVAKPVAKSADLVGDSYLAKGYPPSPSPSPIRNTTLTEPEKALLFSSKAYPSAEFNQAWQNFCEHCFQKTGTKFTDFEVDAKLLHLAQWQDEKRAIAALEYSIRCGSKSSIFEDDSKHRANGNGKPKEDLVDVLRRTMK